MPIKEERLEERGFVKKVERLCNHPRHGLKLKSSKNVRLFKLEIILKSLGGVNQFHIKCDPNTFISNFDSNTFISKSKIKYISNIFFSGNQISNGAQLCGTFKWVASRKLFIFISSHFLL